VVPNEHIASQTLVEVRCLVENLHDILSLSTPDDAVQRLADVTAVIGDLAHILRRPAVLDQLGQLGQEGHLDQGESSPIAS
jgi:hypothetical protein